MDQDELDHRVLAIAKKRLLNIPVAYQEFEKEYLSGELVKRSAESIEEGNLQIMYAALFMVASMTTALGQKGTLQRKIIQLVDTWASCYEQPVIEPIYNGASSGRHSARIKPKERERSDLVACVIDELQYNMDDPFNPNKIWFQLLECAKQGKPPFVGVTEDGLKWLDSNDDLHFLTLKMVKERIKRTKPI